jgi:hypothetical protein
MILENRHPQVPANMPVHGPMRLWLGAISATFMITTALGASAVSHGVAIPAQPQEAAHQQPDAAP